MTRKLEKDLDHEPGTDPAQKRFFAHRSLFSLNENSISHDGAFVKCFRRMPYGCSKVVIAKEQSD